MMIENNYSINVSKMETRADHVPRYYHYCKIELGNMLPDKAKKKFWDICTRFPSVDFELTLDYVKRSSTTIEERR